MNIPVPFFEVFWLIAGCVLISIAERTDKKFRNRLLILRTLGIVAVCGAVIHFAAGILK
jgi:hypothetical protein